MLKRTIYIENASYLKLNQNQLVIQEPKTKQIKGIIPIEDIALLVMDHYQITVNNQLLVRLQGNNVVVVSCDSHHLPFGIMLPLYGHTEHSERVKYQLSVTESLKKQLWKQTIIQKIKNQQAVLKSYKKQYRHMDAYIKNVKAGDITNMEGIASQYYWKQLFKNFYRERFGKEPNNFLNFGYAILRSIVARALVCSGLLPVLGLFHKNKYNPYCLADDVMEPYRPYVDALVLKYLEKYPEATELTKEAKTYLLSILTKDVSINGKIRPLLISITTTTASLYKCFTGEFRNIRYPEFII